ncbi:MAG TPA: site-specific integrase [Flavisolibacter sp.]|nr:site-specific integrase [Flavisolibacter sp.]
MSVTIQIILDTRRSKKSSGKFPLKLRVTFERHTEYYPTIYDLSKEDYDKLSATRISKELQTLKKQLQEMERTAKNVISEMEPFSFEAFIQEMVHEHLWFRKNKLHAEQMKVSVTSFDYTPFYKKFPIFLDQPFTQGTIGAVYFSYIQNLIRQGRIGTAVNIHASYRSLVKFRGNVRFQEISVGFLHEFEKWLLARELSKTTIGIYIRCLRTIFNEAIAQGVIKKEKCYPFGRRKYLIPTSRNIKKALDLSDIGKIYYYSCDSGEPGEQKGKDFWLFSYFANGMNLKDMARLRWKDIHDGYLVFERAKTEHTRRSDPKPIWVFITEDMWSIIQRQGSKDQSLNNYIFPILEKGMTPLREYEVIQLYVGLVNEWIGRIGKKLGIEKKITTYVARHSFSTVLKRSGASTEYIKEALGHTDVKTTENYLDSFGKDVKKKYAEELASFKSKLEK